MLVFSAEILLHDVYHYTVSWAFSIAAYITSGFAGTVHFRLIPTAFGFPLIANDKICMVGLEAPVT
jgi:hypothetical protein